MNTERSQPVVAKQLEKKLNGNGNGRRISSSTLIPIGAVIAVLIALLAGYQWLDDRFDQQELLMVELGHEVKAVQKMTADRWRGSDMKLWTEMLLRLNPEFKDKVPDPWKILDQRKDG